MADVAGVQERKLEGVETELQQSQSDLQLAFKCLLIYLLSYLLLIIVINGDGGCGRCAGEEAGRG